MHYSDLTGQRQYVVSKIARNAKSCNCSKITPAHYQQKSKSLLSQDLPITHIEGINALTLILHAVLKVQVSAWLSLRDEVFSKRLKSQHSVWNRLRGEKKKIPPFLRWAPTSQIFGRLPQDFPDSRSPSNQPPAIRVFMHHYVCIDVMISMATIWLRHHNSLRLLTIYEPVFSPHATGADACKITSPPLSLKPTSVF